MSAQWRNFDASVLFQGVGKQDVFLDGALIEGPDVGELLRDVPARLVDAGQHGRHVAAVLVPLGSQPERAGLELVVRARRQVPQPEEPELRLHAARALRGTRWVQQRPSRMSQGTNVYTWSPLKGIVPPEANPGSTRATYYYQTRNWSIGTSLGF
jgi:hypothetical protein